MCRKMAFQIKRDILFQTLLCSLLLILVTSYDSESDVYCLKSIVESLDDPLDSRFSSWRFENQTKGFICDFYGVECWNSFENRVLNLKLPNMGLKGQLPRALINCSSITGLDLSFNDLSGSIPSDISTLLKFVTTIDLSYNKFTGEIPPDLAHCNYLNTLKLDNNMLRGQIPAQLAELSRIKSISVANNKLSGPVPPFRREVIYNYANNNGLCGEPSAPCHLDEFHQSLKDGLIVGTAFSVTSYVIFALMSFSNCAPLVLLNQEKNNQVNTAKKLGKYICSITRRIMQSIANQKSKLPPLQPAEKGSSEISVLLDRLTSTILFEDLHDATDCFSLENAIGMGKMGIMYQGRLPNGQFLAVKKLFDSQLFKRQFLSELMILGKYRHRNIVPLFGFCIERNDWILAYPYMSNGRLSKWLHPLESEVVRLKWLQRFNIALGIARGLSWLHHNCNLHIVHLNICSECILLDENFEPKISNFGEAKFMIPNTEDGLGMIFKVNDGKKDVFDYGSLLFELITGKTYEELSCASGTTNLCSNTSNFYNAMDKSLTGETFENEVCNLIEIACQCVQPLPDQRPTMLQIYNIMKNIRNGRHEISDDSDTPGGLEVASAISINEIVEL